MDFKTPTVFLLGKNQDANWTVLLWEVLEKVHLLLLSSWSSFACASSSVVKADLTRQTFHIRKEKQPGYCLVFFGVHACMCECVRACVHVCMSMCIRVRACVRCVCVEGCYVFVASFWGKDLLDIPGYPQSLQCQDYSHIPLCLLRLKL